MKYMIYPPMMPPIPDSSKAAKDSQQQAQHESRTIQERAADKIINMLHAGFTDRNTQEQGEEQRGSDWEQKTQHGT